MKVLLKYPFLALVFFAGLIQTGRAAVAFTVTPAAVSNTYSGKITLQVTGLSSGDTVVVQKYLDANTNLVIDAGDALSQQFTLTDGTNSVIGGVTNFNVPGDTDTTAGQITAKLNIQSDFSAMIIGKYLFKLSSPAGHFAPITNSFTVTNLPYAQKFTGTVLSNGVAVPNARVLLFPGSSGHDKNPVGGAVANNSGIYTIQAPVGTYSLIPFKSNFIADMNGAANLVLNSGATISTNLSLIAVTRSISGKMVDAGNSSLGLPGLLAAAQTQNGLIGIGFTDTNGDFTAGVNTNQWKIGDDSAAIALLGYVGLQNKPTFDTTTGSVAGVTISLPKATALVYGTVKDDFGNPLPGVVAIYADDNYNGLYQSDGYTDANGYYVTAVVGGLGSNDPWWVDVDNAGSFPNYIFSQPAFDQKGGTNITAGQAVLVNFTAMLATNHITGNVHANSANVVGVGVNASATIGAVVFQSQVTTDANGNYSLNVANGTWDISVNCNGGNGSLDNILGNGTYQCPGHQTSVINNSNATTDIVIQPCGGVQIFTTNLPDGQVGVFYGLTLQGSTCSGNLNWTLNDPQDFPTSLGWSQNGAIQGTPNTAGTYHFSVQLDDGNGRSTNQNLSLYISPVSTPLQVATTSLPDGTNGAFYTQTIQASGGQTPYRWSIPGYSIAPPPNLTFATNGVLSGTVAINGGPFYFDVEVTDGASNTAYQTLSLYLDNRPLPPLVITNISLPNGTIGVPYSAQLGAAGGQPAYNWLLAIGSAIPPAGLTLGFSGLISGTPTTNKVSTFKVQVTDANSVTTNKVFSITINSPVPLLSQPLKTVSGQFQLSLNGDTANYYTIEFSTNLSNWLPLLVTNPPNALPLYLDFPTADRAGFYRAYQSGIVVSQCVFSFGTSVAGTPVFYANPATGSITVPVERVPQPGSPGLTNQTCLNYSTIDGTAKAGVDYSSQSGTLCFSPGSTSNSVVISILPDPTNFDATFYLQLTTPDGSNVLIVPVVIQNPRPLLAVYPTSLTVSVPANCAQSLTISNAGPQGSVLHYTVVDDGALQGYLNFNGGGSGSLQAGQTAQVLITVVDQFATNWIGGTLTTAPSIYTPGAANYVRYPISVQIETAQTAATQLIGTWSGTWSGISTPIDVFYNFIWGNEIWPTNMSVPRIAESGTWALTFQQVDYANDTASGTLIWQGTLVNWNILLNTNNNNVISASPIYIPVNFTMGFDAAYGTLTTYDVSDPNVVIYQNFHADGGTYILSPACPGFDVRWDRVVYSDPVTDPNNNFGFDLDWGINLDISAKTASGSFNSLDGTANGNLSGSKQGP